MHVIWVSRCITLSSVSLHLCVWPQERRADVAGSVETRIIRVQALDGNVWRCLKKNTLSVSNQCISAEKTLKWRSFETSSSKPLNGPKLILVVNMLTSEVFYLHKTEHQSITSSIQSTWTRLIIQFISLSEDGIIHLW